MRSGPGGEETASWEGTRAAGRWPGWGGAAGVVDAIGARERVDVFVVEIEVGGELAELGSFGDAAERIFGGDLREFQSGLDHAVETVTGEVAGVGAGGALAIEYTHANGA